MQGLRAAVVIACIALITVSAQRASRASEPRERSGAQGPPRVSVSGSPRDEVPRIEQGPASTLKPDKFSPLGFDDIRAYEQAFPGGVGSPLVIQANAGKYWAFRGVAYNGTTPSVNGVWTSLGPETLLENPNQVQKTISGRVAALVIAPRCGLRGAGCRLWVGTA